MEVRRRRQSRYLEKLFSLFLDVEETVFSSDPGNGLASPQQEAGLSYFRPWPLPPPPDFFCGRDELTVLTALSLVVGIGPVRGRRFLVSVKGLFARTRLVWGLFGRSAKGLTDWLGCWLYESLGLGREIESRGDLCEREGGGRLSDEEGFFLALSLWLRSSKTLPGDELNLFLLSVPFPLMDFTCIRTKEVVAAHWHDQ